MCKLFCVYKAQKKQTSTCKYKKLLNANCFQKFTEMLQRKKMAMENAKIVDSHSLIEVD